MATSNSSFQPTDIIVKDLPLPKYYQIEQILLRYIESGEWLPGQQIPIEEMIQAHFQVSRSVVRQAINNLENRGLLWRGPGKGTFVAERKVLRLIQSFASFHEDVLDHGSIPTTTVLRQDVILCPENVAHWLKVPLATPVLHLHRLRFVDDESHMVSHSYVRLDRCKGLEREEFTDKSLFQLIEEKYNLEITGGRRMVEATTAGVEEAQLLGISTGAPLLLLRGISHLKDGTPIEYSVAKYRGDRAVFDVELVRHHEPTTKEHKR
jgi:GntR family transcriptional regulator, N-acetylglucosamine utilization regulator